MNLLVGTGVQERTERNYGVDLLRIISMLMVPTLHILAGVLPELPVLSLKYGVAWLLESVVFCAVNCFALISGFVGYGSKFRYSNIIQLYLQVLFYTLPITAVFLVLRPEMVGIADMVRAIFPFASTMYWYYTAYFCMSFFIPFFNVLVDKLEKRQMQNLVVSIVLIFSVLPTLFQSGMGNTSSGYSALWLALLYLLGAYIKKYGFLEKVSQIKLLMGFLTLTVLNWGVKLGAELLTGLILGTPKQDGYLLSYTSPTMVLSAVLLLLLFSRMKLSGRWTAFVKFFAPAAFGVYLLHEEPLIREALILPLGAQIGKLNPVLMLLAVVAGAATIWLVGSLVDKFRIWLFNLLRIREKCQALENLATKKWNRE